MFFLYPKKQNNKKEKKSNNKKKNLTQDAKSCFPKVEVTGFCWFSGEGPIVLFHRWNCPSGDVPAGG